MIEAESSRKKSFKKRVLAGVGLVGGDFFVHRMIEGSAVAEASTLGFMNSTIDNNPALVLGVTMGVGAVVAVWSSIQNTRLNREFSVSPNAVSTVTFNLLNKICPERNNLRDISTGAAQLVTKDPFIIPLALANKDVLVGFVAAKTAMTVYSLTKAVGSEVILRKKKKAAKEHVSEIKPSGLIYRAKSIGTKIIEPYKTTPLIALFAPEIIPLYKGKETEKKE